MPESTDLVPRPSTEVSPLRPQMLGGLYGFTPREIGANFLDLQIVHAIRTPKDIGMPGYYRLGQNAYQTLDVVFAKIHKFRTLVEGPQDDPKKRKTVCASENGVTPLALLAQPRADACLLFNGIDWVPHCPYAQWRDKAGGGRQQPACAQGYALLGVVPSLNDLPFWFPIRNWQARARVDEFIQAARMSMPPAMGIHEFVVRLTTEPKGEGFVWYCPIFTIVETIDTTRYGALAKAASDCVRTPRVDVQTEIVGDPQPPTAAAASFEVPF